MVQVKYDKTQTRSDPTQKQKQGNGRRVRCRFCKNRMNKHCPECYLCPGYHAQDCSEKWK